MHGFYNACRMANNEDPESALFADGILLGTF